MSKLIKALKKAITATWDYLRPHIWPAPAFMRFLYITYIVIMWLVPFYPKNMRSKPWYGWHLATLLATFVALHLCDIGYKRLSKRRAPYTPFSPHPVLKQEPEPTWAPLLGFVQDVILSLAGTVAVLLLGSNLGFQRNFALTVLFIASGILFAVRYRAAVPHENGRTMQTLLCLVAAAYSLLVFVAIDAISILPDLSLEESSADIAEVSCQTTGKCYQQLAVPIENLGNWCSKARILVISLSHADCVSQDWQPDDYQASISPLRRDSPYTCTVPLWHLDVLPGLAASFDRISLDGGDTTRDNDASDIGRLDECIVVNPVRILLSQRSANPNPVELDPGASTTITITDRVRPYFRVQLVGSPGQSPPPGQLFVILGETVIPIGDTQGFTFIEDTEGIDDDIVDAEEIRDAFRVVYVQADIPLIHSVNLVRE